MARTTEEKMQAALQRKARAEKQLALLKDEERRKDNKSKILVSALIVKIIKENPGYYKIIEETANALLKEQDRKIVLDYLAKYLPASPQKEDQPPA